MNKYFTPSVEDIRVGYECEIARIIVGEYWDGIKMPEPEWMPLHITDLSLRTLKWDEESIKNSIRVPYLTKEQIEKEGWVFEKEAPREFGLLQDVYKKYKPQPKNMMDGYSYEWTMYLPSLRQWGGTYGNSSENVIIEVEKEGGFMGERTKYTCYWGTVKDINAFRYLCKLLNIN